MSIEQFLALADDVRALVEERHNLLSYIGDTCQMLGATEPDGENDTRIKPRQAHERIQELLKLEAETKRPKIILP